MKPMEKIIQELIRAVGENPKREGLSGTPRRVARAYEKFFSGYKEDPKKILTVFENEGYDEMIVVSNMEWYSFCEHHMIPFFGKAHVGYLPDKKIAGLSKIPRVVDIFSRRLQNQERLTSQIADALNGLLKPKGVGVILSAQHLCMMARGVGKQHSDMVTSCVLGAFRDDRATRQEFMDLLRGNGRR